MGEGIVFSNPALTSPTCSKSLSSSSSSAGRGIKWHARSDSALFSTHTHTHTHTVTKPDKEKLFSRLSIQFLPRKTTFFCPFSPALFCIHHPLGNVSFLASDSPAQSRVDVWSSSSSPSIPSIVLWPFLPAWKRRTLCVNPSTEKVSFLFLKIRQEIGH